MNNNNASSTTLFQRTPLNATGEAIDSIYLSTTNHSVYRDPLCTSTEGSIIISCQKPRWFGRKICSNLDLLCSRMFHVIRKTNPRIINIQAVICNIGAFFFEKNNSDKLARESSCVGIGRFAAFNSGNIALPKI